MTVKSMKNDSSVAPMSLPFAACLLAFGSLTILQKTSAKAITLHHTFLSVMLSTTLPNRVPDLSRCCAKVWTSVSLCCCLYYIFHQLYAQGCTWTLLAWGLCNTDFCWLHRALVKNNKVTSKRREQRWKPCRFQIMTDEGENSSRWV